MGLSLHFFPLNTMWHNSLKLKIVCKSSHLASGPQVIFGQGNSRDRKTEEDDDRTVPCAEVRTPCL